jgi:hypothetical protein
LLNYIKTHYEFITCAKQRYRTVGSSLKAGIDNLTYGKVEHVFFENVDTFIDGKIYMKIIMICTITGDNAINT